MTFPFLFFVMLPLFLGLLGLFVPFQPQSQWLKIFHGIVSFLSAVALFTFIPLDSLKTLSIVQTLNWVPSSGIFLSFKIDALSFCMMAITSILIFLAAIFTPLQKVQKFHFLNLMLLQSALMGVFLANDALCFYFFWELMLIPFLAWIFFWGKKKEVVFQFIFFLLLSSFFILAGFGIGAHLSYEQTGHLSFLWEQWVYPLFRGDSHFFNPEVWMFVCFFIGFGIKIHIPPFHSWLISLQNELPPVISGLVSSLLFQAGAYGFLRIGLHHSADALHFVKPLLMAFGVFAAFYGALLMMVQKDLRSFLSMNAISHAGYFLLGISLQDFLGNMGILISCITHGIALAGLFFILSMVGKEEAPLDSKLLEHHPRIAIPFFLISLSLMAFPMTGGFVGEFLLLSALFKTSFWCAIVALIPLIVSASQWIKINQSMAWQSESSHSQPMTHAMFLAPVVIFLFLTGIFPGFLTRSFELLLAKVSS